MNPFSYLIGIWKGCETSSKKLMQPLVARFNLIFLTRNRLTFNHITQHTGPLMWLVTQVPINIKFRDETMCDITAATLPMRALNKGRSGAPNTCVHLVFCRN